MNIIFLLWESERICICNSIKWEFFPNAAQRDNLERLKSVPTCSSLHVLIAPYIRHLPGWPQRWGRSAPGHLYLRHLTTASSGEKSYDILAFASFFQIWEKKQVQLSDCLPTSGVSSGPIFLLGNRNCFLWRYWWRHWTHSFLWLCYRSRETRWGLD